MTVAYTRLVMAGTNAGGNSWSTGLSLGLIENLAQADLQSWLDTLATSVGSTFNAGANLGWGALTSNQSKLTELRAYTYPNLGGPAAAQAVHDYTTPVNGASSGTAPYTCACVATLLTGVPGRANRGRMYLPADGTAFTSHQFSSTQCAAVATGVINLIDAIQSSTAGGGNPIVIIAGAKQLDPSRLVKQVRVDSLPDVQRRRQDKVQPTATSVQNV
jgi:hypothetical protein